MFLQGIWKPDTLVCIASIVSSWLFKKCYLAIGWMDQSEAFINNETSIGYTKMRSSYTIDDKIFANFFNI